MEVEKAQEFYWTVVGNIDNEQFMNNNDKEMAHLGTKHFRAGAKVHIIDWFPGTCERIVVIGQHRKSRMFMSVVMSVAAINNFRIKTCFNPAVIRLIKEHTLNQSHTPLTEQFAKWLQETLPLWQLELKKHFHQPPI